MSWEAAERAFDDEVVAMETLPRTFERTVDRNADGVAQRYKGSVYDRSLVSAGIVDPAPAGEYADLTYGELAAIVRRLTAGLRELGVTSGTRVAIHAHTRMEWAHADFAALAAGAVVTTVYPSSSRDQLRYLLADPEATVVITENRSLLERVLAVHGELEHELEAIVVIDDVDLDLIEGTASGPPVYTLGALHELGDDVYDEASYRSWVDAVDIDDLASLIYTSGTTGTPKGVRLTHANFRSNLNQCYKRFGKRPDRDRDVPGISADSTTLSFLPLAHVFERLAGHYMMFAAGATVGYAESPDTLREDFGLVRPTTTTSVPRVYEKLYDAIREQASESPIKERIFEWAVGVGRTYHETDDPGRLLDAKRAVADRLVFSSVREAIGDNVEFFISGGGSLSAELCALYHAMELPIFEGYGLTETSPVICVNPPSEPRVGTIGPPVVDTEIAIDVEMASAETNGGTDTVGELLVRGPQVTEGYWDRPDATREAFTDPDRLPDDAVVAGTSPAERDGDPVAPWFRTGDIVRLRPDGYIAFHERIKGLLVLSTGKNVAPGPIEDRFATNEFVEQCVVLGDGRKFVSALIVPNLERVREWAETNDVDLPEDRAGACRDDRVHDRIRKEVDRVNEAFEPHERIKQFRLVPEEFSEENDLLTPTMKKKRRNILDRFADDIELIYQNA